MESTNKKEGSMHKDSPHPEAPEAAGAVADATVLDAQSTRPLQAPAPSTRTAQLAGLTTLMSAVLAACGGGSDSAAPAPAGAGSGSGTGGGVVSPPGSGPTLPSPSPTPSPAPTPSTPSPAPTPSPTPTPPATPITAAEAARFLLQAQLSARDEDITAVQSKGYAAWLDEQMSAPSHTTGWDWLTAQGYNRLDVRYNQHYTDFMMWNQLIAAPDSVRKRVALAWSEIIVVSTSGTDGDTPSFSMAAYWDLLNRNAFGSYRQLLQEITLNPAMGGYLNTKGNQKENAATGRVPDENYAREVMQLFSIGLYQLNIDGTLRGGAATETYGPSDVSNLARIFTGYNLNKTGHQAAVYPVAYRNPMVATASRHSNLEARFLGATVPAGADPATRLTQALDIIANHPNVGPFIGRQLIQRLVTSNPSAAYVGRVAAVFNNNGAGVRGDLRAVTKAVLLDTEARGDPSLKAPSWGKLREPMLRFVQWARTFSVTSSDNRWILYSLENDLGQSPLRSPSVFNFFRPGYVPAGTALASTGQPAPEFQITNENTVATYINFMRDRIAYGYSSDGSKLAASYARELALVNDPAALVARLNLLLTANQLSPATVSTIRDAITTIKTDTEAGRNNRVWAAVLLVMSSPDYIVQK
jgi:uncharacterized protein (DUF1800 family)